MQKRIPFEYHLLQLSILSALPFFILLILVMFYSDISIYLILLTIFIGSILLLYCLSRIKEIASHQFRSLSNLLDAMIQGDYSLRARPDEFNSALDELIESINGLAIRLTNQRLESVESQLLVKTVIKHIDVAIIALDHTQALSFVNPTAQKLLNIDAEKPNSQVMKALTSISQQKAGHSEVVELSIGEQYGRFNIHVETFRESGLEHKLLFITDVRNLLRTEERKAWQSLVRVISHEINNSLAPILSISETLNLLISKNSDASDISQKLSDGLQIIADRSESLGNFVNSYEKVAKLPDPKKEEVNFSELITKIIPLFNSANIELVSKLDVNIQVDPVQFEQLLINLIKNAAESNLQNGTDGSIKIQWSIAHGFFKIQIHDEGVGISNPDNLFVPFYTTKKSGSGIGLLLCRQIVESHLGQIYLKNRHNHQGCTAVIKVPLN